MSPAEVVSSRHASVTPSGERPLAIVIETMKRWLDGESVWPYAKILDVWGMEFEMYRKAWTRNEPSIAFDADRAISLSMTRNDWIKNFGFAIPCAELLDELAKARHVVEVGAGSGYMTRLMRHRGIDVIGSDFDWRGPSHYGFMHAEYDAEQVTGVQGKTMARRYRDSTIFCSWPSLDLTWFRQMLRAMQIGQRIVVIHEDSCAEDSAWNYLDDCFKREAVISIPTFQYMNDIALVYVKKRQRSTP